ncbi:hypothetical protein ACLBKS_03420 [Hylemonella sp. W303a]|uniref:hypothetical protein n=1 Tax=Hylemonella sp. W303a TaxID=3389873 RepID=UPI00396B2C39
MKQEKKPLSPQEAQATPDWIEIRREDIEDGSFNRDLRCVAWMKKFLSFVTDKVGLNPRTRVYAYKYGSGSFLAMDIFGQESDSYVAVTICLTGKTMHLSSPTGEQLDIALPGIVDAFGLIQSFLTMTKKVPSVATSMWIAAVDTQVA